MHNAQTTIIVFFLSRFKFESPWSLSASIEWTRTLCAPNSNWFWIWIQDDETIFILFGKLSQANVSIILIASYGLFTKSRPLSYTRKQSEYNKTFTSTIYFSSVCRLSPDYKMLSLSDVISLPWLNDYLQRASSNPSDTALRPTGHQWHGCRIVALTLSNGVIYWLAPVIKAELIPELSVPAHTAEVS